MDVDVSIIILTKNAGEKFNLLMEKIFSQKFMNSFEVLVLDSGSQDKTIEIAKKYPVKLIQIKPAEFHHGQTRNYGAEMAKGKILIYITQDALPVNEDWLINLTDPLRDPEAGMVSGRQLPWQTTKPPEKFYYHYYFPDFKVVIDKKGLNNFRDNTFISNVNSAIRKDVWNQFKFSENIMLTEDKEFAARIFKAGWKIIYEPNAAVYHAHDFNICSIFWRSVEYGISVRQGKDILEDTTHFSIKKIFNYFYSEIRYLAQMGCFKWIPYSLIYDISRNSGTFCGKIGLIKNR